MNVKVVLVNSKTVVNAFVVNTNIKASAIMHGMTLNANAVAISANAKASATMTNTTLTASCALVLVTKNYLYVLPQNDMQWITQDNPLYYYIKSNTNWNIN